MRQMQLSSGVFRTTVRQRFANLNPQIATLLAEHLDADAPLSIHDWAASSCLTSAEWTQSLFTQFPSAHLTCSDLTLYLLEATLPSGEVFVFEQDGALLQYLMGPFVIRLVPPEPRLIALNSYLGTRAPSRFQQLAPLSLIPSPWLQQDLFSTPPLTVSGTSFQKIPLVHPEAGALAVQDPRFHILQHSAFDSLSTPVDVIRSMNIFNNAYFPPAKLASGARAVWHSLRPGGLWIVGRTVSEDPPVHEVTVFRRTADSFERIWRDGPGSEIEALVLATSFPA